jgi:uncharacterized membrane protein YdbT with pleckstrin-like domain
VVLITCPECQKQVSSLATTCPNCGVAISRAAPSPLSAPPSGPSGPEQTVWTGTPSAALLVGHMIPAILGFVILPVLAYLAYSSLMNSQHSPGLRSFVGANRAVIGYALVLVVALAFLPSLFRLAATIARVKSIRYTLSNQRLIIEKGFFSKTLEEIDMRYVDETQFSQGFLEGLLGIGEIRVVSSDKLAPNFVLLGIKDPRSVRELIRAHSYQASQKQFFTRST